MIYKTQLIKANIIRLKIQNYIIANPVSAMLFKSIAKNGYGSNQCLKNGYLPVPVHFYSPIPDLADLERQDVWHKKSALSGIDFNIKGQLELLKELGNEFGSECEWPMQPTGKASDFYLDNNCFSYGCATALHSMVRKYKPKKVIEIGSGYSSKVIAKALELNAKESGKKSKYTIIDPYPSEAILGKSVKSNKVQKKKVEEVDPNFFKTLANGDILFIDSSHSVKIGGDVNYLYLEVLPILNSGVIIHIHDIELPYEYPEKYSRNESFRQFWTEQYLLQSFLAFNNQFEVLLGMAYLAKDHIAKFKKAFPKYNPEIHKQLSGSFWMRRK
jgi:predicted O-methyltransferase YrrM